MSLLRKIQLHEANAEDRKLGCRGDTRRSVKLWSDMTFLVIDLTSLELLCVMNERQPSQYCYIFHFLLNVQLILNDAFHLFLASYHLNQGYVFSAQ